MATVDRIHLNVPFSQKDQAKMLGARWDPLVKKWYVSPGVDLAHFTPWLPPDLSLERVEETSSINESEVGLNPGDSKGLALSSFLAQVSLAIATQVPKSQWVRAEISQFRPLNGGHISLELAEHSAEGKLQARLQAFLWNGRAQGLLDKFEQATGAHLATGLKVMLQLSAEFNATYGLRGVIEDIDPAYTLGDIAAKLNAIREALLAAGVFTLNKGLPSPTEFCRVAVISPKEAAGLGDFRQDANRLEQPGICEFVYYTATFQGEDAPRSLLSAISDLRSDVDNGQHFDAVCIIRGGGSVTDLYWLNDHALADAVCRLSIPVFTGIGHERDNTILDEIAHQRFDTPSKVIGHISGTIYANAGQAIEQLLLILKTSGAILAHHEQQLDRFMSDIQAMVSQHLLATEHDLDTQLTQVRNSGLGLIREADHNTSRQWDFIHLETQGQINALEAEVDHTLTRIRQDGQHLISQSALLVESFAREILGVGPKATLRRGFSLARDQKGQPITSAKSARKARHFDLEFHDGQIPITLDENAGGKKP
jgi:exodeoxyribonuclease VII large subunit